MCYSCSVKIGEAKDLTPDVAGIALNGVMNDNLASIITWAWCINEDKVKAAFKSAAGLDVSDNDLITLSRAHQLGNDVKVYKVNFLDVVKGIKFTQVERDNASCKVILTR